jgi:hypothetical protein
MKDFYKQQVEDIPDHLKVNSLESQHMFEMLKKHSRQLENYIGEEEKYQKDKEKHLYFLRFILLHTGDHRSNIFYVLIKIDSRWYCFNHHRISVWKNEDIYKMSIGHDEFCAYDTYTLFYTQGTINQIEMIKISPLLPSISQKKSENLSEQKNS